MTTIGWIDALKRYNLGGTSWCIPRKGTAGYETIMKIRKGEETKTPQQLIAELERKTGGKPKAEKRSMSISLDASAPEPKPEPKKKRTVKAKVPKESSKDDMPTYKHDDAEYEKKLAEFKKMVGYKD